MNMKKSILYLTLAALLLSACAKTPKTGVNDAAKRYLDAWMQVNHPGATQTPLGAFILEDIPGTGRSAGSTDTNPYVFVNYTVRNLDGSVAGTSDALLSQQLGTYDESSYYGPAVWSRGSNGLVAGIEEAISAMNVGGRRKFVVPGWLLGVDSSTGQTIVCNTAQEYLDKVSGGTPRIYDLELVDVIPDILKWQIDSVGRYISRNFSGKSVADSVKLGIYYFRTAQPTSTEAFKNDTTIYINYIGRRLDGAVFDTSIADTAKYYGIYSASRTYGPCAVKWYGSDGTYSDIKMKTSGSDTFGDVVNGFSFALSQMHAFEKGTAVFVSNWGYGTKSSGNAIPAYSPLRFDLEVVAKPEE
jgi:FKBP-type peptidyl-prolyl cis-trans isomerase